MKRLFWKVFLYFGIALVVLSAVITFIFTNLNQSNIMDVHLDQIQTLAKDVSTKVRNYAEDQDVDGFVSYQEALDTLCEAQNTDVWILANDNTKDALDSDYTNVDIRDISKNIPEETSEILTDSFKGQIKYYSDYDDKIYDKAMLHLSAPIYDNKGNVSGAVLLNATVEGMQKDMLLYQKYLVLSIVIGLLASFILVTFFTRQITKPISRMKQYALLLAAGEYSKETQVKRRDEIGQLANSLDVLTIRLKEAEELRDNIEQNRRDFFSTVSHELRTPITVVKGYAETLVDGYASDPEKQKAYYERILKECLGMERLVSDLLILSKMDNPEFKMDRETINIIAVLQDAVRSARILSEKKKSFVKVAFSDECSFIFGDYDRIKQLFLILLQNAIKYSPEGAVIQADVKREDKYIHVYIRDNGIGMDDEDQEKIFDKFYRGKNHTGQDGSGLGLVVAKRIVEKHEGTIVVRSKQGQGTEFEMVFRETEPPQED